MENKLNEITQNVTLNNLLTEVFMAKYSELITID